MKINFNTKSAIGLLFAVGAGIMAFFSEMDNQKKDAQIEDMEKRITNLEKGKGS